MIAELQENVVSRERNTRLCVLCRNPCRDPWEASHKSCVHKSCVHRAAERAWAVLDCRVEAADQARVARWTAEKARRWHILCPREQIFLHPPLSLGPNYSTYARIFSTVLKPNNSIRVSLGDRDWHLDAI